MTKIIKCLVCGEMKEHKAFALCNTCYRKQRQQKIITCKNCGLEKPHSAFGLCKNCYMKNRYENNKEKFLNYGKNYYHNHKKESKKYNDQWRKDHPDYDRERRGHQSMSKNKSCNLYLGVHIAEQVLSKVFKDVQVMPMHNRGFDFICSNNYKIDVKSSCRKKSYKSDVWSFHINKNTIADYFLCLAFDNRTNLNPEHIWLIKGSLVSDKVGISITESKISKWDEYRLNINKVINCCDNLKGGK